jgi:hypothetical protein
VLVVLVAVVRAGRHRDVVRARATLVATVRRVTYFRSRCARFDAPSGGDVCGNARGVGFSRHLGM